MQNQDNVKNQDNQSSLVAGQSLTANAYTAGE